MGVGAEANIPAKIPDAEAKIPDAEAEAALDDMGNAGSADGDNEGDEGDEGEDDDEAQAMDQLQQGASEEPVERVKFKSPISAVWTTQGKQALMKGKAANLKTQLAPPPRPAKIAHRTGVCCFLSLRTAKRPPPCTDASCGKKLTAKSPHGAWYEDTMVQLYHVVRELMRWYGSL